MGNTNRNDNGLLCHVSKNGKKWEKYREESETREGKFPVSDMIIPFTSHVWKILYIFCSQKEQNLHKIK